MRHILSSLLRHKFLVIIMILEIMASTTIVCNACFLLATRLQGLHVVSGVNESALALLNVSGFTADQASDINSRILSNLQKMRGVQSVNVVNSAPFGPVSNDCGISLDPPGNGQQRYIANAHFYVGDQGTMESEGIQLQSGRPFQQSDFSDVGEIFPSNLFAIVSQPLAARLWPKQNALGKVFWVDKFMFRVIGVVHNLARPDPTRRGIDAGRFSVLLAGIPGRNLAGTYLIRGDPSQIDRIMGDSAKVVAGVSTRLVFDAASSGTISNLRKLYFKQDIAMVWLLISIIGAVLLATSLGIGGLSSFWVKQRYKTVGIRRAVGATSKDIVLYFQAENLLITTAGVVLGLIAANACNLSLMRYYEFARLPFGYLLGGALMMFALGQFAVIGSSIRAAKLPPVTIMRLI
jgi:putative ABC transport system permease protein